MKVLIVSPHTDDAEFGCGGTIAKLIEYYYDVHWAVFCTADNILLENKMPADMLRKEFQSVIRECGLREEACYVHHFDSRVLPDHRQEILNILVDIKRSVNPEIVIGPSLHDLHQDHSTVALEVVRAFKRASSIICYELPWNHITFDSELFVRLEDRHMEKKWAMLEKYKSQFELKKPYFSKDLVYGMASMRGSQIDMKYAEAFEVVRWII